MNPNLIPLPDNLPSISTARLPALYEEAITTLAACARVDECWSWADRMEALASYARQSEDDTLLKFAMRIKARAVDRSGEILRATPTNPGRRTDLEPSGGVPTRFEIAYEAGLSKDQAVTAIRVNRVPRDVFEHLIGSETPPTITQLAELGTRHSDHLQGRDPNDFEQATRLIGLFTWLDDRCGHLDIEAAIRGLDASEFDKVVLKTQESLEWFEELWGNLNAVQ